MSDLEHAEASSDVDESHTSTKPRKAPNAFRTISEVADDLHIPQHVLRFWETKFSQVKPLKRGGGRRYYRPDDIALLRRISDLLYAQGYTIKGVQRLLRESGGHLADAIPPAPAAESEEAPTGKAAQPTLPMPGLAPERKVALREGGSGTNGLREVLERTLRELEELRALLA